MSSSSGGGGVSTVRFDDRSSSSNRPRQRLHHPHHHPPAQSSEDESSDGAAAVGISTSSQRPSPGRRLNLRPHTAAAPFLDARGNRTQPSREPPQTAPSQLPPQPQQLPPQGKRKLRRKRSSRPKTAIGIEQHQQQQQPGQQGTAGGSSEPNFPTLNPRVFHALRGFLTPESLRKTKFYSEREDKMVRRREVLDAQQEKLHERIGTFYRRLDSFIAETNAAANWEPEDKRKQKSLLDRLDDL